MNSFLCVTSEQIVCSQIVHRQEEVRRVHVDHDLSCETQLLELVSLNSVGHPVFVVFLLPFFQPDCSRSLFN